MGGSDQEETVFESAALANALPNSTKFKSINFDDNNWLTENDWRNIFQCMRNPRCV